LQLVKPICKRAGEVSYPDSAVQWWWESRSFIASAWGAAQRARLKQDCAYWLGITDPHFLSEVIRVYVGSVWQQQQFVLIRLEMEF